MADKKHILNLTVVVIVAVLFGVILTVLFGVQQANNPAIRQLMSQQEKILSLQREFTNQLKEGRPLRGKQAVPSTRNNQQALEKRIATLEQQVKNLTTKLQNLPKGSPKRQGPPSDEFTKIHKIDVLHSPVRGNKRAPVTIVEFVDFQCPFCARFHPVINEVMKAYPKQVNYVLKNFPLSFHQQAKPAAKAAFAAGEQGKYWEMADALLENSKELNEEKFKEIAKSIGLNVKRFMKAYKNKDAEWEKLIVADIQLGQKVAVRGTPTFYINGRKTNARDLANFKREIDQILKKK